MKRKLFYINLCLVMGILSRRLFENAHILVYVLLVFIGVLLSLAVVFFTNERQINKDVRNDVIQIIAFGLMLFCISSIYIGVDYNKKSPLGQYKNQVIKLTGIINRYSPVKEEKYVLSVSSITLGDGTKVKVRTKLKLDNRNPKTATNLISGNEYEVVGYYRDLYVNTNPNTFNEKYYLKTKNITGVMYYNSHELVNENKSLHQVINKVVDQIDKHLKGNLSGDTYPIGLGMIIGVDDYIDKDTLEDFRSTGTAHILTVSGFHYGVIFLLLNTLTTNIRLKYVFKKVLYFWVFISFLVITGGNFSGIRAFQMLVMLFFANATYRQFDMFNGLNIVSMIILITNPYLAFSVSYQLSYLCVLSIAVVYPMIYPRRFVKEKIKKIFNLKIRKVITIFEKYILSVLFISLAVQITILPVTSFHFNRVSIWTPLFNIVVSVFAAVIMPICIFLGSHVSVISRAVGSLGVNLINAMKYIIGVSRDLPLNSFYVPSPSQSQLAVYYLGLFLLIGRANIKSLNKTRKKVYLTVVMTFALAAFILFTPGTKGSDAKLMYFDVGQGDSSLIITKEGTTILVDSGLPFGDMGISNKVLKAGVGEIDYLIVYHPHNDHMGGFLGITKYLKVNNFMYSDVDSFLKEENFKDLYDELKGSGANMIPVSKGDVVKANEIDITVLHPNKNDNDPDLNEVSLVISIELPSVNLIYTGDISKQIEYDIIDKVTDKNYILKAPHHGSRKSNSDELLLGENMKLVVFQVGRNNYGHPSKGLIESLNEKEKNFYRNDLDGCITVYVYEDEIKSRKFIGD